VDVRSRVRWKIAPAVGSCDGHLTHGQVRTRLSGRWGIQQLIEEMWRLVSPRILDILARFCPHPCMCALTLTLPLNSAKPVPSMACCDKDFDAIATRTVCGWCHSYIYLSLPFSTFLTLVAVSPLTLHFPCSHCRVLATWQRNPWAACLLHVANYYCYYCYYYYCTLQGTNS
jgi:hypothetical protein